MESIIQTQEQVTALCLHKGCLYASSNTFSTYEAIHLFENLMIDFDYTSRADTYADLLTLLSIVHHEPLLPFRLC